MVDDSYVEHMANKGSSNYLSSIPRGGWILIVIIGVFAVWTATVGSTKQLTYTAVTGLFLIVLSFISKDKSKDEVWEAFEVGRFVLQRLMDEKKDAMWFPKDMPDGIPELTGYIDLIPDVFEDKPSFYAVGVKIKNKGTNTYQFYLIKVDPYKRGIGIRAIDCVPVEPKRRTEPYIKIMTVPIDTYKKLKEIQSLDKKSLGEQLGKPL